MSWFTISDLAKSALNEAQKRIDKVLDIQEENGNSQTQSQNGSVSTVIQSPSNTDLYKVKTDEVSIQPSRVSPTERKVNSSITKKRSKPAKLGASLTKRQISCEKKIRPVKNTPSEPNIFKCEEQSTRDGTNENDTVAVISVEEPTNKNDFHIENTASESSIMTSSTTDETTKDEKLFTDSGVDFTPEINTEKAANELNFTQENTHIPVNLNSYEDINGDCQHTPLEPSPVKQIKENIEHEISNHLRDSPCGGSTATSSEIDILDQESVYSDTFTNSKMSDIEGNYPGSIDNYFSRDFCDRIGSEASDFSRITSPLSVNENENVGSKSPILFTDHFEKNTNLGGKQEEDIVEEDENNISEFEKSEDKLEGISSEHLEISDAKIEEKTEISEECDSSMEHHASINENKGLNIEEENVDSIPSIENEVIASENPNILREFDVEQPQDIKEEIISENEVSNPEESIDIQENEVKPKESSASTIDNLTQEKLAFYDQQLVSLSLSNAALSEENDNLRSEIGNAKLIAEQDIDSENLKLQELVKDLNKTIENLKIDKESLSDQLSTTTADLSQRLSSEQVQHLISEKEESIQGLLQEGEQLSKQHLQQNNLIKKLRSKLTEKERNISDSNETLKKYETDNKKLNERLSKVEGQSSENRGTAERLSEAYHERSAEVEGLQSRLEDAEEKRRAAQSTLDAAYKDLAELHKKQVAMESEKETQIQKAEQVVITRMQQQIEKIDQENEHQKHMLLLQINELHATVERTEVLCSRKEDQLRKEIKDLQQCLQESEMRNHDLSNSISDSTRPLLRQMENLQVTHSTQSKTWEALEKNLTARLADAQVQTTTAQEKERTANMFMLDLKSKLITSEQHVTNVKGEKQSLIDEVEKLKSEIKAVREDFSRSKVDWENESKLHSDAISKARKDRLTLENQLDMEKLRSDVDRKKFQAQYEAIQKEKERLAWISRSESVGSASMFNVDADSTDGSEIFNHVDGMDRQLSSTTVSGVYDSIRSGVGSGSALLENLQSQLKQRDGEIAQLQGEINTLERTRSSMAEEIVRLTNMNEDLENSVEKGKDLTQQLKDMKARHEAVLTMYGEKEEEAEELKMDLEDVKAMYRNQIDLLMQNN